MSIFADTKGAWAGRLGTGLQNQLERFNSARHLEKAPRHRRGAFCLCVHRLAGGDCDHLVDVIHGAAAAEIVDRAGDTLEDRSDGVGVAEPLDELVADVADLEVGEYEDVGVACDLAAGSLLGAY